MASIPPIRIAIPVYDHVDMLDVTGPYEMFDWAGFKIDVIAATPGMVMFRSAFCFQVKLGFDDCPGPYDAVWVPGGDPQALANIIADPAQTYLNFVRTLSASARITASVCEGASLLAAAGLLDGYRATTHWAFIDCFARWPKVIPVTTNPRFVVDRDRLTGGGISSGLDEALQLIMMLTDRATAESVQLSTQYFPDPPVSGTIPPPPACPIPAPNAVPPPPACYTG